MLDEDTTEDQYERRKFSVIQALHYQYRNNRGEYLEYLGKFLSLYCDFHHKELK